MDENQCKQLGDDGGIHLFLLVRKKDHPMVPECSQDFIVEEKRGLRVLKDGKENGEEKTGEEIFQKRLLRDRLL